MSPMSERRDTTLNDSELGLGRRARSATSFHCPKYSLMVGTITTTAVNASEDVGRQARAARSSSPA